MNKEGPLYLEYPERPQSPRVARKASRLVAAIEGATPDSPASLNLIADGKEGISGLFAVQLKRTDELYDAHEALFFSNYDFLNLRTSSQHHYDYPRILALSHDVITNARTIDYFLQSAHLGLGVLQLAEAGAQIVQNPSLVVTDFNRDTFIKDLIQQSGSFAEKVFETGLDGKNLLIGNINKFPLPRVNYPGYLMATHRAFWEQHYDTLPEVAKSEVDELFNRFPSKTGLFDMHSMFGRPDRAIARQLYVERIKNFTRTLDHEQRESAGTTVQENVDTAIPLVISAFDATLQKGHSPERSFQIVVQESGRIGRLTELTASGFADTKQDNRVPFQFDESSNTPQLIVDLRKPLSTRNKEGGVCPARSLVLLDKNGKTYSSVEAFSAGIERRVGATPPLLRIIGNEAYVDPAALVVNYALFSLFSNYKA